ncbi:Hsp20/alpha crystallin family protein [Alkalihalobacillus oceani]|uniref:Hsp20/alpha crystallin family protein n=1 Tax=Halalkalibacter oceani TaxID=1653776 RepID=UPI00203C0825|nr:Hsp20/alpha crystallin family protein [Halalkalibacter oceani]MCM3760717.1 Hsp20/alpha crystallin family protein [Halalkalibacter oceani]
MSEQRESKKSHGYHDILKSIDDFFTNTYQQLHDHPLFLAPIPVRISEDQEHWIAEAELPGIDKRQIQLDIYRQSIRIQINNEEHTEYADDTKGVTKRHSQTQIRQRTIPVPFYIDEKSVKASYKNGLLRIVIPTKRKPISIDS